MRRQGGKVRNPGGKPFGFIGAMDARKPVAWISMPTMIYYNVTPWDMRMQSLSFLVGKLSDVAPPRADRDLLRVKGI
jgi:hypothetical protein